MFGRNFGGKESSDPFRGDSHSHPNPDLSGDDSDPSPIDNPYLISGSLSQPSGFFTRPFPSGSSPGNGPYSESEIEPLFRGHSDSEPSHRDYASTYSSNLHEGGAGLSAGNPLEADFSTLVEKPSRVYMLLNSVRCCRNRSCAQYVYSIYPVTELWVCLVLSFLSSFANSLVTPTLWQYLKDRPAGDKQHNEMLLGYLLALFTAGQVLGGPLLAFLGHRFSFKLAVILALLCSLAGETLYFVCPSSGPYAWLVFLGRSLVGIGSGVQAVAQACISEHAFGTFKSIFLGRLAVASLLGFFAGPCLGSLLADVVPPFTVEVGGYEILVSSFKLAPAVAFFINCGAFLVAFVGMSFAATTERIRLNHLRRMNEANYLDSSGGFRTHRDQIASQLDQEYFYQRLQFSPHADSSGWKQKKITRYQLMLSVLILQFWICSDITGFEPIVLLYSNAAYDFTTVGTQLLFAGIGFFSLLGFAFLLLVRRSWKSVHAEPAVLIASLFGLAVASGVLLDPTPMTAMNKTRFLVGVALFSMSFPVALVESASVYALSTGQRMKPLSVEMLLWTLASGLARISGPIWSTYTYTLGEDPWVFFCFALVGSALCIALICLIWRWVVDRQHLKRAIETSAILQQEAVHLIN